MITLHYRKKTIFYPICMVTSIEVAEKWRFNNFLKRILWSFLNLQKIVFFFFNQVCQTRYEETERIYGPLNTQYPARYKVQYQPRYKIQNPAGYFVRKSGLLNETELEIIHFCFVVAGYCSIVFLFSYMLFLFYFSLKIWLFLSTEYSARPNFQYNFISGPYVYEIIYIYKPASGLLMK